MRGRRRWAGAHWRPGKGGGKLGRGYVPGWCGRVLHRCLDGGEDVFEREGWGELNGVLHHCREAGSELIDGNVM